MAVLKDFDETQGTLGAAIDNVGNVLKNFRRNPKIKRIIAIDAFLLVFLNKIVVETAIDWLGLGIHLPPYYNWVFWGVVALLFVWAVLIKTGETLPPKPSPSNSCIKGPISFEEHDKEIFKSLQRDREILDYRNAINQAEFRIGVLTGESGCGKTSLLAAGLLPTIENDGYKVAIITFANESPDQSIFHGLKRKLDITDIDETLSIYEFLTELVKKIQPKPLVLIIDQFEQFFTQNPVAEKRRPFVEQLKLVYDKLEKVKILISIRRDFFDDLFDIQKSLKFSFIANRTYFSLKKFTPGQTISIFRTIAERESIGFGDEAYLLKVVKRDLASSVDGLVSPVDIQIVMLVLRSSNDAEFDFSEHSFEKAGGIAGMLERYVKEQIDVPNPFNKNNDVLNTLVSLIDINQKTRKGQFIADEIKERNLLNNPNAIQDILVYLIKTRIIREIPYSAPMKYELGHEKLIEPILSIYDKANIGLQKVNYLLEKRVNEWIANNRNNRFLLSLTEYFQIKKYKKLISWGGNELLKKQLITRTARKVRNYGLILSLLIIVPVILILFSNTGIYFRYRIKNDAISLVNGTTLDNNAKTKILESLFFVDKDLAISLSNRIDTSLKCHLLSNALDGESGYSLRELLNLLNAICDSTNRYYPFKGFFRKSSYDYNETISLIDLIPSQMRDNFLYEFAIQAAESSPDTAIFITEMIKDERTKHSTLMGITYTISDRDIDKAFNVLNKIPDTIFGKEQALVNIIRKAPLQSTIRLQDLTSTIKDTNLKKEAFSVIFEKIAKVDPKTAITLFKRVKYSYNDSLMKFSALLNIAKGIAEKDYYLALRVINKIPDRYYKNDALLAVAIQLSLTSEYKATQFVDSLSKRYYSVDFFYVSLSNLFSYSDPNKSLFFAEKISDFNYKISSLVHLVKNTLDSSVKRKAMNEIFLSINRNESAVSFNSGAIADTVATIAVDSLVAFAKRKSIIWAPIGLVLAKHLSQADSKIALQFLNTFWKYNKMNKMENKEIEEIAITYMSLNEYYTAYKVLNQMNDIGIDKVIAKLKLLRKWEAYRNK